MSGTKPKAFLKHTKGKKKRELPLDDADDYLAAAIEDEDAMGKHRGGDPEKSLRFGRKALDLYTAGLSRFPRNFDLAYNKARLELEIATHPAFIKILDVTVTDLLRQCLMSHQYALDIEPDNADSLFNSAQVLTALAEQEQVSISDSLAYLEQALEYQGRCLQIQEVRWSESRRLQEDMAKLAPDSEEDDEGGAKIDAKITTAFEDREDEEKWATVVEPVTADTLLDTLLAQLATLTTLCSVVSSSLASTPSALPAASISWIENYSTKLLGDSLSSLLRGNSQVLQGRMAEAALTKATCTGGILELAFRSKAIDAETYRIELEAAFSSPDLDPSSSPDALLAHAHALITFNGALADSLQANSFSESNLTSQAELRWNVLSKVQKLLTNAASLPSAKVDTATLATIHMLRGDASLLLHALSYQPVSFPQAVINASQLLKNAEVFYRNAMRLSGSLPRDEGQVGQQVAELRGGVVAVLQKVTSGAEAEATLRLASRAKDDEWRQEQLQDMVDDGLLQGSFFDHQ